jgi:hypothetical protein
MRFSDETVMAYADGELDAATCAALEAALPNDPELAERLAQQRALRARLQSAFDPVLDEPVPERLLAAARAPPATLANANVIALRPAARARWSWPQWSAIAASLVCGALLGPFLFRTPASGPFVAHEGVVRAAGALEHALTEQLASSQSADAPVQIGLSFRARAGQYCRTFVLRGQGALAGLACRDGQAWRVQVLAATEAQGPASGYRPAASTLPPAVTHTVDELIAGDALDANAEAAARAHDWRR